MTASAPVVTVAPEPLAAQKLFNIKVLTATALAMDPLPEAPSHDALAQLANYG